MEPTLNPRARWWGEWVAVGSAWERQEMLRGRERELEKGACARGEGRVTVTEKGGDGWRGEGGEEADRG